jgi:class 3 adenylate cyclase
MTVRGRLIGWLRGGEASALEMLLGPDEYERYWVRLPVSWLVPTLVGVGTAAVLAGSELERGNPTLVIILTAALLPVAFAVRSARFATMEAFALWGLLGSLAVLSCIVVAGARFEIGASSIPAISCVAFINLPRRTATLITGVLVVGFSLIVLIDDGYVRPGAHIAAALTFTLVPAVLVGWVVGRIRLMSEQLASAHTRLQRYVPSPVASGVALGAAALAPRREAIGVVSVDLRGFTGFSARAEPEDVEALLAEYYAVVAQIAVERGAVIGSFAGDGLMTWLGDPIETEHRACAAVELALALVDPLRSLTNRWSARGLVVGYGIGVTYGYATLGTIGSSTRQDYTALGTVVNLASRLCGIAHHDEILLDARAREFAGEAASGSRQRTETLKGFPDPVTVFVLEPPGRS